MVTVTLTNDLDDTVDDRSKFGVTSVSTLSCSLERTIRLLVGLTMLPVVTALLNASPADPLDIR